MIEFSTSYLEIIYKFLLASILGGIIGVERSFFKKQAGLRTFALVSLGACLFTSSSLFFLTNDPTSVSRVLANLVVGIGFLGAGVIFLQKDKIYGLTTAAALWVTAAIGGAVGLGLYFQAFLVTLITIIILTLWYHLEKLIRKE
ncbi:MAG: magnesium transporter MgtC [Patescibacteria group bacterium]